MCERCANVFLRDSSSSLCGTHVGLSLRLHVHAVDVEQPFFRRLRGEPEPVGFHLLRGDDGDGATGPDGTAAAGMSAYGRSIN